MLKEIAKKAVKMADSALAWSCLLVGTALVGISILGIVLPLMLALPLLALAIAYFERQASDASLVVAVPA